MAERRPLVLSGGQIVELPAADSVIGASGISSIFDHSDAVLTTGTTEELLYSGDVPADTLAADGDKLRVFYAGTFATGNSKTLKVTGFEDEIFSTATSETGYWSIRLEIIRLSSSSIRFNITIIAGTSIVAVKTDVVTGLDFTADTTIDLYATDTATGDTEADMGYCEFIPAAPAVAAPPAFAPDDIAGLLHWADFSDAAVLFQDDARTTPVTADGDALNGVEDKSSNAAHLIGATYGTTYKTNIINGHGVSRGDAVTDNLKGTLAASGLSQLSVYGVFRTGSSVAVTNKGVWDWADNTYGSGAPFILLQINSGNLRMYVDGNFQFSIGVSANTVYQVAIKYDGTNWHLRLNGADQTNYTGGTTNKASSDTLHYHHGYAGASDTDIGEWFIYDSALSGGDDTNAETYLKDKWGAY